MAKYTSKYPSLGFYVNGELKQFSNGSYVTDDKDVVAVLDGIIDAVKVDEPKTEAKPAPQKASTKRTASAK